MGLALEYLILNQSIFILDPHKGFWISKNDLIAILS